MISKQSIDGERDAESGTESVSVVKRGMAFGVNMNLYSILTSIFY